jgi:hypothetical protein
MRNKRINWLCMPQVYCHHKIYSRHEDLFIYINIAKNHQQKLIERTKSQVNHDGDWRRINMDLASMNYTSEKSKWESWRRGTVCDGEGQVDVWVRSINQAMKSHIALSVDIYWINKARWQGQEEKSRLYKSKKSIVTESRHSCSSQDHIETLKLW